jgi:uncharacterized protein YeeX (DUF496 family)
MNVKKEVIERIKSKLIDEMRDCDRKIYRNKYKFKELVEEQTILKREMAKLSEIIKSLSPSKE